MIERRLDMSNSSRNIRPPVDPRVVCRIAVALLFVFLSTAAARAQSQSTPPATTLPPAQAPPKTASSPAADAASKSKSTQSAATTCKFYNNDNVKALPPSDVTQIHSAVPPLSVISEKEKKAAAAKQAAAEANQAAYWKARFTAARQKLDADQKAIPVIQRQLSWELVNEESPDEITGQIYSDTYMDLLHQMEATKLAIQQDKQALSDLHDEFRKAGGLPGWIR
ncbi:MAG TPA: hypothetical protein VKR82_03085 [Candidatus Acidoferrales bacterium]|nr:hypothetical protein [Candidatus Acidoferrales bacterium]